MTRAAHTKKRQAKHQISIGLINETFGIDLLIPVFTEVIVRISASSSPSCKHRRTKTDGTACQTFDHTTVQLIRWGKKQYLRPCVHFCPEHRPRQRDQESSRHEHLHIRYPNDFFETMQNGTEKLHSNIHICTWKIHDPSFLFKTNCTTIQWYDPVARFSTSKKGFTSINSNPVILQTKDIWQKELWLLFSIEYDTAVCFRKLLGSLCM